MDLYQLKTFVAVAQGGSITRAAELVHLSQPAVSAHIKALEDELGLALFDRTSRGMTLTADGKRLLTHAEQTIAAHRELLDEAARARGKLTGRLTLAAGSTSNHEAIGRLLSRLSARCPEVAVTLEHRASLEILAGLRNETIDAGFYNEAGEPDADLSTVEVATFGIFVVAPTGLRELGWKALEKQPWIFPTRSTCCSKAAERIFAEHHFRPARIISVDREGLTRTLVASGVGVGLLHDDAARAAERAGEAKILADSETRVRVLFAQLARRAKEPVLTAATGLVRA
ncbi:MAG: LysR family transcriptional regulator [Myxococcales bacterium]|nr:LysR family transcriptional regulator [Myxococcales bacterium]